MHVRVLDRLPRRRPGVEPHIVAIRPGGGAGVQVLSDSLDRAPDRSLFGLRRVEVGSNVALGDDEGVALVDGVGIADDDDMVGLPEDALRGKRAEDTGGRSGQPGDYRVRGAMGPSARRRWT